MWDSLVDHCTGYTGHKYSLDDDRNQGMKGRWIDFVAHLSMAYPCPKISPGIDRVNIPRHALRYRPDVTCRLAGGSSTTTMDWQLSLTTRA